MDKNDFKQGLQDLVKKPEKNAIASPEPAPKKGVGRPKEHDKLEKTTVAFEPELMGKLRMLCLQDGVQIREVLGEALERYISEYEQEHGSIRVPSRFREPAKK